MPTDSTKPLSKWGFRFRIALVVVVYFFVPVLSSAQIIAFVLTVWHVKQRPLLLFASIGFVLTCFILGAVGMADTIKRRPAGQSRQD